jgi:hypothetical protein
LDKTTQLAGKRHQVFESATVHFTRSTSRRSISADASSTNLPKTADPLASRSAFCSRGSDEEA